MSLKDISQHNRYCVLAIDHRDSLRNLLSPDDLTAVSANQLTELKVDIVRQLAPQATGVMLEPEYSIPQVIDAGALPKNVGFVAALEAQGYLGELGSRPTTILQGWPIEAAAKCGAAAVKLLLPYHPDRPLAAEQRAVARDVIAECREVGIALVLEPLFYGLSSPLDRRRVVIETTREFVAADPHLLKLPFPVDVTVEEDQSVWLDACTEMNSLIPMPWTLLSGGGSFEAFYSQVEVALMAGASGCMVGRALWGEAAQVHPSDRPTVLKSAIFPRISRLYSLICS